MNKKDTIKAIKGQGPVYIDALLTQDDVVEVRAVKSDLLDWVSRQDDDMEFSVLIKDGVTYMSVHHGC